MWRSTCATKPLPPPKPKPEDDWETDSDFVNNVSEKESRWGAKTIQGSGHQESLRLDQLREEVLKSDVLVKEKTLADAPKPSLGYGGKFGVQSDRVDKCAESFQYEGKVAPHASQKDYTKGFGGTFGIEKDKQDKSAVGWDHHEKLEQHESQKDYAIGFGGKHGIQSDRVDKSAVGWDHRENVPLHDSQKDHSKGFGGKYGVQDDRKDKSAAGWDEPAQLQQHDSQKDYKQGFGGKFGVQSDRKDKSAVGWEHRENVGQHESQTDYKQGFGGKFGVQTDRVDKSAASWEHKENLQQHESQTDYKRGFGGAFGIQSERVDKSAVGWDNREDSQLKPQKKAIDISTEKGHASSLRSRFEQLAVKSQDDKVKEERERRRKEDEELRQKQANEEKLRQQKIEAEWEVRKNEQGMEESETAEEHVVNSTKSRPSIGVRLPFATTEGPPKPIRTSEQSSQEVAYESQEQKTAISEEELQPKIPMLPTITKTEPTNNSLFNVIPRRQLSSDNEQANDDEWEQNDQRSSNNNFVQQPLTTTDAAYKDSTPISEPSTATKLPNHTQYDYVPEEPDVQPTKHCEPSTIQDQRYEEPPCEIVSPAKQEVNSGKSSGLTAIALYEYEQADDDEIGFEVNDIITDIEQIDVGWWRGMCKGRFGLFPANYVQLRE